MQHKSITVGNSEVSIVRIEREELAKYAPAGTFWIHLSDIYDEVFPDWYINTQNLDKKDLLQMAGIDDTKVDYAVPQAWFDQHVDEIRQRGGAVWNYSENNFGQPLWMDDVRAEAMFNLIEAAWDALT